MIIWPARLAEKYITVEERKNILGKVNGLVQTDKWHEAISQVIGELGFMILFPIYFLKNI